MIRTVTEVVINRFYVKLQLLPTTRQDSVEFIFHQDVLPLCAHDRHASFWT